MGPSVRRQRWRVALAVYQLLILCHASWAPEDSSDDTVVIPQDCTLECLRQEGSGCDYCRISRADVERTLGFRSVKAFGSCVPWPCLELVGRENPEVCQHYVHAPKDVTVETIADHNPKSDSIVISWKPSYYGIAFLRGFQVSLQALGGPLMACQLYLFHSNVSLPASHAQKVYRSDPFTGLTLGAQYAVTVMALPVPEEWDRFYHKKIFSTRTCADKNGLEQCKKDWYPKHIEVQQKGADIIVTFNLAPPHLGILKYFSFCYGEGTKQYTDITPDSTTNKTHYSYVLLGLQEGANYTCEIAADEVDAVRKTFNVQVLHVKHEAALPLASKPALAVMLPLGLAVAAIFVVLLIVLIRKKPKVSMKKLHIRRDIIKQHHERSTEEEVTSLTSSRLAPPRLLICYSSCDGPAHVRAVMQLGAFLQQHMATQVCLDLWDSLSLAEEGTLSWHCRRIQESDFVLVVCSRGLNHRPVPSHPELEDSEELGSSTDISSSVATIAIIGEEIGRAKARGRDLSKYMTAVFEYSVEMDIPAELRLVSRYILPRDMPLLFSHLHGVALHRPGGYLKVEHISEEGFTKLPAGAALQWAIREAEVALKEKELLSRKQREMQN